MIVFIQAKKDGFADKYLARLLDIPEKEIRDRRLALGLEEAWDSVPVSGADAAYYYSTYNSTDKVDTDNRQEDHGAWRRTQPHRAGH
jgi:carbamoyl-phosphate synthase large subunit